MATVFCQVHYKTTDTKPKYYAGITVVAMLVGLALIMAILAVVVFYLNKRRRRWSSKFMQNNVKTDQESRSDS